MLDYGPYRAERPLAEMTILPDHRELMVAERCSSTGLRCDRSHRPVTQQLSVRKVIEYRRASIGGILPELFDPAPGELAVRGSKTARGPCGKCELLI